MTRRSMAAAVIVLLLGAWAAAGEITGTLSPPGRVSSVRAVDRETKREFTGDCDRKTGTYRVVGLPAGTYDLVLETDAGRIEGVNLSVGTGVPKREPVTLEPSELDRGEIDALAAFLAGVVRERSQAVPTVEWLLARVRQGAMAEVCLGKGAFDAGGAEEAVKVPLRDEERPQVSDVLLGLLSMVRVRDQLPRDYDLVVDVRADGPRTIRVVPARPEMTDKDRRWITDWVDHLKIFENKKRVLDIDGTADRARVLVEKLRDQQEGLTLPVSEPTAFWRVEIFDFQKYYGGWNKEKYTVIVRQRVSLREFRTYRWMFEKRLGGIRVTADGVTGVPQYEVPEKVDPARGRVPY